MYSCFSEFVDATFVGVLCALNSPLAATAELFEPEGNSGVYR